MELINPIDAEEFKKNFSTIEPFPHFCIDNFLNEDFAYEIYESFPTYQEAQKQGRDFKAINESRKIQVTDSSLYAPAIKKLNDCLASKEFLEMFSDLTGIPDLMADPDLMGGGIHETKTGGHLDVHVDFNYDEKKKLYRRLNILIYFNKDWKEEYGGQLELWDKDVKKRYGYFEPKFNRACGFLTSDISFHGVTQISCPPDVVRKSFASYFYTKSVPENWPSESHSTIFKARPSEFMKGKVSMPIEQVTRNIKSSYKGLKESIKGRVKK